MNSFLEFNARLISVLLHPVICPAFAISFFCPESPEKLVWILGALFILCLLPLAASWIYFKSEGIEEIFLVDIKDRKIPFYFNFAAIFLFFLFLVFMEELQAFPAQFLFIYALVNLFAFAVTLGLRFKISLHLLGWGSVAGIAAVMGLEMQVNLLFLATSLYWARLHLNSHSHSELLVGYASGFVISVGAGLIIF